MNDKRRDQDLTGYGRGFWLPQLISAQKSVVIAAALIVLHPTEAQAADPNEEARVLYVKGRAAFQEGDDVMAREYYKQSLALEESVEALCNLGLSEARSKLYADAYEHLRLCTYLFPEGAELEKPRESYATLRDKVRAEISFEEAHPIDERVDQEIKRREVAASEPEEDSLPASGLDPDEESPEPDARQMQRRNWVPAYIAGGITGVAFGTSMVFLAVVGKERKKVEALSADYDDSHCLDPSNEGCAELGRRIDRHDDYALASNAALITAGVGAAATVGYVIYVLAKNEEEPPVRASLSVERTGGFFAVAGSF